MGETRHDIHFYGSVQGIVIGENNNSTFTFNKGPFDWQYPQIVSFPIWNVPYRPNPLFTGRDDILLQLHNKLETSQSAALTQPQAISGLGGIGKTQVAIEYCYRYRDEYPIILWVRADSQNTLITDFIAIAELLYLPERMEKDQDAIVAAVKRWLTNQKCWLLIMDNADNLDLVYEFIPVRRENTQGHILLTTRAYATGGIAHNIEVEKMLPEEGTLLLLKRARIIASDILLDQITEADPIKAETIVTILDGLPLALDQAGAYIEDTNYGLAGYLDLYQAQRATLLKERGNFTTGHPASVATTFSLAFQKMQETNSSAVELLRLCSFLQPDVSLSSLLCKSF